MAELVKVHSMPGSDVIEYAVGARHHNDFLAHGNREYIRNVSGAKWIKFWISWHRFQNSFSQPADIWSSWAQLRQAGNANGNYFARLDELIKAANDDGLGVILQVDQYFPTWSNGGNRSRRGTGSAGPAAVFPDSVASDSPWGWWISYLICRYRMGVAPNPTGPTAQNVHGNPLGASLYGIEFCNEPNLSYPADESSCWAAEMFKTVEFIAAIHWPYSGGFGGVVLGPGAADWSGQSNLNGKHYDAFTRDVLGALPPGWQPRVYLGWSHHNYGDIDETLSGGTGSSRLERVRGRLHGGFSNDANNPWRSGDRNVYITEGAPRRNTTEGRPDLTAPQEAEQRTMTRTAFLRVRSLHTSTGAYPLYAQHALNDVSWIATKYGVRQNFNTATWTPGPERPLASTWRTLPL